MAMARSGDLLAAARLPRPAGASHRFAPLFAQLRPIFQTLADFALEAALGRIVEYVAAELFREIVLAGERLFGIVIVFVSRAITLGLHQLGRCVEDVFGRQQRAGFFRRAHRLAERHVGGIRFRRSGDVEHGFGDGKLAFRRAEEIVGVLRGIGDDQRLRIGKSDILDRHADDPAREIKRVLAGIEHAAEIIERGVGIGATHRFVQGADEIVVAVLLLVVDRRAPLHHFLQGGGIKGLAVPCSAPHFFRQRQRRAAVAVRHADQRRTGVGIQR